MSWLDDLTNNLQWLASGAGLFWTLPTLGEILGAVALASLIAETSTRWRVLGRLLARRPSAIVAV